MIQCTKCKKSKNRKDFYIDKRAKFGLRSECKTCTNSHHASRKHIRAAYNKKWAAEHKEQINTRRKNRRDTVEGKLVQYKNAAKRKNRKFKLTKKQFASLVKQRCYYCGEKEDSKNLVDIDRIDSSGGYILSNCVSCCKKCNKMKMDESFNGFLAQIVKIYKMHYEKK